MSKNRMFNTRFWSDVFIVDHLNPLDRYLFIYLMMNERVNLCGVYEISTRTIAHETGIEKAEVERMIKRLEPKVHYRDGWIILKNGIKHQNYKNSKIAAGLQRELCNVPAEAIELIDIPKDFNMDFSCPIDKKDESSMSHTRDITPNLTKPNVNLTKLNPTVTKPNAESEAVDKSDDDNRTTGLKKLDGRKYSDITILYDDLNSQGLVNSKYKAWYCSQFFKLGREKVLRIASESKADGKDPQKLFNHKLSVETGSKVGAK